jgi:protein TonB
VDVHPSPQQPVRPEYPDEAGMQGVAGNITLLLLIDERGVVREASVMEANPEGYFEESALGAFRAARFAPAQKNGRAVKSRVLIRVTYELGSASKSGIQPPAPFRP